MRRRRGGAGAEPGPVDGSQYRRALARERALLGCVRASLLLLTGAACAWAYPEFVAGWARGFLRYYLAGLAACSILVGLVLAARCGAASDSRWFVLRMGAAGILLVATLPVVVAVTVGR